MTGDSRTPYRRTAILVLHYDIFECLSYEIVHRVTLIIFLQICFRVGCRSQATTLKANTMLVGAPLPWHMSDNATIEASPDPGTEFEKNQSAPRQSNGLVIGIGRKTYHLSVRKYKKPQY